MISHCNALECCSNVWLLFVTSGQCRQTWTRDVSVLANQRKMTTDRHIERQTDRQTGRQVTHDVPLQALPSVTSSWPCGHWQMKLPSVLMQWPPRHNIGSREHSSISTQTHTDTQTHRHTETLTLTACHYLSSSRLVWSL